MESAVEDMDAFEGIIGRHPSMQAVFEVIRRVAPTDATVLITGESGTGKELVAAALHKLSARALGRFVPVHCGAIPEELLESEMFGHERGAFTGAVVSRVGRFKLADGGTIFLDEIGEMSPKLQVKLLRVLENGRFEPVGSVGTQQVDVRIIAATNRTLDEAVAAKAFREDLFYRLRVVPIKLPPLRKRTEDIPLLANYFLSHYWERHRPDSEHPPKLTEAAMDFLRARPWRGNVRELQNVIEHVTVIAEPNQHIQPDDIPLYDEPPASSEPAGLPVAILNEAFHAAKEKLVVHFEKEYLSRLVMRAGGNMSKAARLAGIDRTTLYRLMEKHGFRREELAGGLE